MGMSSPTILSQHFQINPRTAAAARRQQIHLSHFWSGSASLLSESHSGALCTPGKGRLIFHSHRAGQSRPVRTLFTERGEELGGEKRPSRETPVSSSPKLTYRF